MKLEGQKKKGHMAQQPTPDGKPAGTNRSWNCYVLVSLYHMTERIAPI